MLESNGSDSNAKYQVLIDKENPNLSLTNGLPHAGRENRMRPSEEMGGRNQISNEGSELHSARSNSATRFKEKIVKKTINSVPVKCEVHSEDPYFTVGQSSRSKEFRPSFQQDDHSTKQMDIIKEVEVLASFQESALSELSRRIEACLSSSKNTLANTVKLLSQRVDPAQVSPETLPKKDQPSSDDHEDEYDDEEIPGTGKFKTGARDSVSPDKNLSKISQASHPKSQENQNSVEYQPLKEPLRIEDRIPQDLISPITVEEQSQTPRSDIPIIPRKDSRSSHNIEEEQMSRTAPAFNKLLNEINKQGNGWMMNLAPKIDRRTNVNKSQGGHIHESIEKERGGEEFSVYEAAGEDLETPKQNAPVEYNTVDAAEQPNSNFNDQKEYETERAFQEEEEIHLEYKQKQNEAMQGNDYHRENKVNRLEPERAETNRSEEHRQMAGIHMQDAESYSFPKDSENNETEPLPRKLEEISSVGKGQSSPEFRNDSHSNLKSSYVGTEGSRATHLKKSPRQRSSERLNYSGEIEEEFDKMYTNQKRSALSSSQNFQERMEKDIIFRHHWEAGYKEYVEQLKPKLSPTEVENLYERLINDAKQRTLRKRSQDEYQKKGDVSQMSYKTKKSTTGEEAWIKRLDEDSKRRILEKHELERMKELEGLKAIEEKRKQKLSKESLENLTRRMMLDAERRVASREKRRIEKLEKERKEAREQASMVFHNSGYDVKSRVYDESHKHFKHLKHEEPEVNKASKTTTKRVRPTAEQQGEDKIIINSIVDHGRTQIVETLHSPANAPTNRSFEFKAAKERLKGSPRSPNKKSILQNPAVFNIQQRRSPERSTGQIPGQKFGPNTPSNQKKNEFIPNKASHNDQKELQKSQNLEKGSVGNDRSKMNQVVSPGKGSTSQNQRVPASFEKRTVEKGKGQTAKSPPRVQPLNQSAEAYNNKRSPKAGVQATFKSDKEAANYVNDLIKDFRNKMLSDNSKK